MLHDKNKLRQRVEKKMQEDLQKQGYTRDCKMFKTDEEYEDFMTLQDEEFEDYLTIITIIDENEYRFYTTDDVMDKIIGSDKDLEDMCEYVGIDEALQQAKEEKIISGFKELGYDLWVIGGFNDFVHSFEYK